MELEDIKKELRLRTDYYSDLKSHLINLCKEESKSLLSDLLGIRKKDEEARGVLLELGMFASDQLEDYQALLECVDNPTEENITLLLLHADLLYENASQYLSFQRANRRYNAGAFSELALNERALYQDIKKALQGRSSSYPYIRNLFSPVEKKGVAGFRVDPNGIDKMLRSLQDFFYLPPPIYEEIRKMIVVEETAPAAHSESQEKKEKPEIMKKKPEGVEGQIFENIKMLTAAICEKRKELSEKRVTANVFLKEFVTVFYSCWPTMPNLKKQFWDEKEQYARKVLQNIFHKNNREVVDFILNRILACRTTLTMTKKIFEDYFRKALCSGSIKISDPIFGEINQQKSACEDNILTLQAKINFETFAFSNLSNLPKELEQHLNDCGVLLIKLEEKILEYQRSVESIAAPLPQEAAVEVLSEEIGSLSLVPTAPASSLESEFIPSGIPGDDPFKTQTTAWKALVAQRREEKARRKQTTPIAGPVNWYAAPEAVLNEDIVSILQTLKPKKYALLRKIVFCERGVTFAEAKNIIKSCHGTICEIGNGSSHKRIVLGNHSMLMASHSTKGTIVEPHGKKQKMPGLSNFNLSRVADTFHRAGFTKERLRQYEQERECTQKLDTDTKSNAVIIFFRG